MPVLKSEAACSAPFVPSGASAGRVEGGQLRTIAIRKEPWPQVQPGVVCGARAAAGLTACRL